MAEPEEKGSTGERFVSKTKEEIIKEAHRIEQDALTSAKAHFVSSHFWSAFHVWLGAPTAVLAAIASASSFLKTEKNIAAGVIAGIVAALSAIGTFLNPTKKAGDHFKAGNSYDALKNRARIFRTIDCWGGDSDAVLTRKLKDLSEERNKSNRESPQPSRWAYEKAKKAIEAGEAEYSVDQNKDLPG